MQEHWFKHKWRMKHNKLNNLMVDHWFPTEVLWVRSRANNPVKQDVRLNWTFHPAQDMFVHLG